MKVSVVMPAYNASQTIASAIMSIKNQSHSDWELIIVNDGSDDTKELENIIMKFDDGRIIYKKIEHGGVVKARMTGYEIATGELLAVQDADDLSMPDRLEKAVSAFTQNPEIDVFVSSLYVSLWHEDKQAIVRSYRPVEKIKKESLLKAQTIPGIPVFRREVLEKKPLRIETQHAYDWMMYLDWVFSDFVCAGSHEALYEYVRHQNSLSERNEREGRRHESLLKIKDIMKDEYNVEFKPKDWEI